MSIGAANHAHKQIPMLAGAPFPAARPAAKKADHDADDASAAKAARAPATNGPGQVVDRKV